MVSKRSSVVLAAALCTLILTLPGCGSSDDDSSSPSSSSDALPESMESIDSISIDLPDSLREMSSSKRSRSDTSSQFAFNQEQIAMDISICTDSIYNAGMMLIETGYLILQNELDYSSETHEGLSVELTAEFLEDLKGLLSESGYDDDELSSLDSLEGESMPLDSFYYNTVDDPDFDYTVSYKDEWGENILFWSEDGKKIKYVMVDDNGSYDAEDGYVLNENTYLFDGEKKEISFVLYQKGDNLDENRTSYGRLKMCSDEDESGTFVGDYDLGESESDPEVIMYIYADDEGYLAKDYESGSSYEGDVLCYDISGSEIDSTSEYYTTCLGYVENDASSLLEEVFNLTAVSIEQ